jgi:hypothetical protein
MNVRDLMTLLADMDPDAEVRLMLQPNYPFEHKLRGVAVRHQFEELDPSEEGANVVFLLEGGQVGYGNSDAFDNELNF